MQLKRAGSQPSTRGPAEWFTGTVRIDPLHSAAEPSRVSCASVTFEPGARTNWHTHPLGQTLIVTSGCGWTQCDGESDPGDPRGRCHLVPTQSQALAWCVADHGDDAHRDPGGAQWHPGRVDGASHGRAVSRRAIQQLKGGGSQATGPGNRRTALSPLDEFAMAAFPMRDRQQWRVSGPIVGSSSD